MQRSQDTLLNRSAKHCLDSMLEGPNSNTDTQFWQTWANVETIAFILKSKYISQSVKQLAEQKGKNKWANFDPCHKAPTVFVAFFNSINKDYWDHRNQDIIWDDKLWLGNSYLALYQTLGGDCYLQTAIKLYQLCVEKNTDWRESNYRGLEWKPKTDYRNSITNELFFVLCARLYEITKEKDYGLAAEVHYKLLFCQEGKYINNSGGRDIFPDAEGPNDFYSYNQGVALEGLAYMLKYAQDKERYMNDLVRLTNGMIDHFRDKDQPKFIMKEFSRGDHRSVRTGATFRSFVFRHLLNVTTILNPEQWNQYKRRCPKIRTFLLDNAQAMCKFESLNPSYHWELYEDGLAYEYGVFNQFFVLLAAEEICGIKELVLEGVTLESNGFLCTDIKRDNVIGLYLATFRIDDNGVYKRDSPKPLPIGAVQLSQVLNGERLNMKNSTRNILELIVVLNNETRISFVLFHAEGSHTQYAILGDRSGEEVINNFIVRHKSVQSSEATGKEGVKVQMKQTDGFLVLTIS